MYGTFADLTQSPSQCQQANTPDVPTLAGAKSESNGERPARSLRVPKAVLLLCDRRPVPSTIHAVHMPFNIWSPISLPLVSTPLMSIYTSWSADSAARVRAEKGIGGINWDQLCQYASKLKAGVPCRPLQDMTSGLHNLVRLLEFDDGTRWVARIRINMPSQLPAPSIQSEVDVMLLVRERTSVPVPHIFGFGLDDTSRIGAPFMLMELVPGVAATDADGGWNVHHGRIPQLRRPSFHAAVADVHAQLASVRFPKIGTIIRRRDLDYEIGPFPNLGGPFDTARAFFEAWAAHAKFPRTTDQIRSEMTGGPAREVLNAIDKFPSLVRRLAHVLDIHSGPFPVVHTDLFHSNILIDDSYGILGVIDWEGACTLPWELMELPLFLETIPALFDAPWNYDQHGEPLDSDQKLMWEERRDYIASLRQAERLRGIDSKLSGVLDDPRYQSLAYALRMYHEPGKLGFYDRVIHQFEEDQVVT